LPVGSGLNFRTIQPNEGEASASLQSKKALASALDLDIHDLAMARQRITRFLAAFKRDGNGVQALQPLPIQQIYQRNWFAVTGRHVTVDEMGACIADTNPAGVLALARSVPTSKEESAAFTALGPNLGACLRAGTKLQASRQALRAALSEALYQRLHAPFATPAVEAAKK